LKKRKQRLIRDSKADDAESAIVALREGHTRRDELRPNLRFFLRAASTKLDPSSALLHRSPP